MKNIECINVAQKMNDISVKSLSVTWRNGCMPMSEQDRDSILLDLLTRIPHESRIHEGNLDIDLSRMPENIRNRAEFARISFNKPHNRT